MAPSRPVSANRLPKGRKNDKAPYFSWRVVCALVAIGLCLCVFVVLTKRSSNSEEGVRVHKSAPPKVVLRDACDVQALSDRPAGVSAELRLLAAELLSYGTRVGGSWSAGYNKTRAMISTMASCTAVQTASSPKVLWDVAYDDFVQDTVVGKRTFSNIVAHFGAANHTARHLVLAAHYDSKLFENFEFLGACDSAVPVVMLLHLMKFVSRASLAHPQLSLPPITVLFLDGEEAFIDWKGSDNTYGSRHLASQWEKEGRLSNISLFVLLDLLGTQDLPFHNYFQDTASTNAYNTLKNIEQKRRAAKQVLRGEQRNFFPQETRTPYATEDDHVPWMQRGVPILHLIPMPFPDVWHTPNDKLAAIDFERTADLFLILWNFIRTYK